MVLVSHELATLSVAVIPFLILRFRRGTAANTATSAEQSTAAQVEAEERLRAEQVAHERTAAALRDTEERFANAFDAAPIGMLLIRIGANPPTVWTNRAFRALLGYEDDELIDPPADKFIHPDDLPQAYEDAQQLARGEVSSYQRERCLISKDGRLFHAEVRVSLTRDDDGVPQYMINIIQDITARKDAEAALLRKTAELEAVFEAVPDMFFRVNKTGTILGYLGSSHAQPFSGPDSFIGQTIRQVLPDPPAALIDDAVKAVCRDRAPRTIEYALQLPADWRTYEARVWPLPEREAIAIVRDVTEARQRQEQLAHLLRVTTMSEMAATLAHEVHQPLQAIINFAKGCVERVLRQTAEPPDLREPLERIAYEAIRAGEIVRRMREFLRTRQPQREWVNLADLLVEAVRLAEPEAMRQGVAIDFDLDPDLPKRRVDPVQIQQVVLNLVRNSIDALAAAPADARTIVVAVRSGAEAVRLSVRDSGPGFSREIAERMFSPMFTTKPYGLGMGLAISRAIVEGHGGSIRALCEAGHGSTVEVILPLDPSSDEASGQSPNGARS
jgi:two-component system sensor kinase FixL